MKKFFSTKMILSALLLAGVGSAGINGNMDMSELEKKEFVESLDPEMVNYLIQNPEVLMSAINSSKEGESDR